MSAHKSAEDVLAQCIGVPELSQLVRRTPDVIRGDARRGTLGALRAGERWLFTPEQVKAALAFYDDDRDPEGPGGG